MPHFPEPFFRTPRKLWYVHLDGKQVNLGPDRDRAFRKYGEQLPSPDRRNSQQIASLCSWTCSLTGASRSGQDEPTSGIQEHCQGFSDTIPATLVIHDFKPFHIHQWVDSRTWNDGMNGCSRSRTLETRGLARAREHVGVP
jgi:hypothetical protein